MSFQEAEIVISVKGLPPAKGGLSILSSDHRHHARVMELLRATAGALPAGFVPYRTAVGMKLTVWAPTPAPPGDPTNFLGGIADVLQRKILSESLGALGPICVYENDLQLRRVQYEQRLAPERSYEVRLQSLGGPVLVSDARQEPERLIAEFVVDVFDREDLAVEFVNIMERARRRDLSVDDALSLLTWLRLQRALPDAFLADVSAAVVASADVAHQLWAMARAVAQALQRRFLGERHASDAALLTQVRRASAQFELIDLDSAHSTLAISELRGEHIAVVFWPILWSALGLLRPATRHRIGVCADETCRRLFVDRTKNNSKTWCSLQCTTRAKVRAYRMRQSELSEGELTYVVD